MNRLILILLSAILLLAAAGQAQDLLVNPESVAFDAVNDRYLVSSYGNGSIVAIAADGTQTLWYAGLVGPLGCEIVGNRFYVSTIDKRVIGIDLTTATLDWQVSIPTGAWLDGITWDGGNFLYVVDNNGRILKVNIATQTYTEFVGLNHGLTAGLQDVVYDGPNNRLIAVGYYLSNSVLAVDLTTTAVTIAMAFPPLRLDGVCISSDGYVYFSSHHNTGRSERWNGNYGSGTAVVASGLVQPAGCCYRNDIGRLAVACHSQGRVVFFELGDLDGDGIPALWDNCPEANNPDQTDLDGDGAGDACDLCTDTDNDGFGDPGFSANTCTLDNCSDVSNPDQTDQDQDGVGDVCDNCLLTYNPLQEDLDHSGIGDDCEGCCVGRVGDVNAEGGDEPTISDISSIIDMLFLSGNEVVCIAEADLNLSGGASPERADVTIGDISILIDYLFLTGPSLGLPACP